MSFDTVKPLVSFHQKLNVFQAKPVIGSLAVSPVKACLSVAQIIVGAVGTVFSSIAAYALLAAGKKDSAITACHVASQAKKHCSVGLFQLANSITNFCTLGFQGRKIAQIFDADDSCLATIMNQAIAE